MNLYTKSYALRAFSACTPISADILCTFLKAYGGSMRGVTQMQRAQAGGKR